MPAPNLTPNGNFMDDIRMFVYCPVCHYRYNPLEAKIVEQRENAHLIHLRCRRCYASFLALILANAFGISSVGLVTDLDSFEVSKFKGEKEIATDEVIEFHQWLDKQEGLW